jgi:hypothetical protein
MKNKNDMFACFKDFHKGVQTQYEPVVKVLRSDNGTEYTNIAFREYLSFQRIQHQTTCPYTPEQNGVAERKNRHLLEVARSMMISMNVPKYLWGQAVLTATMLINRRPSRVLEWKSPFEMLKGENCDILPLKIFGCVCFVQDYRPNVGKLDPRAVKCIFVGYSTTQKGCVLEPCGEEVVLQYGCHISRARTILLLSGYITIWRLARYRGYEARGGE